MKKRQLLALMLTLFTLGARAQKDSDTPYTTKTFTENNLKALSVETSGGSIVVAGGQSNFKVEMYVKSNNSNSQLSKEELEDRLNDFEIKIATEGDKVIASAKRKENIQWDNKRGLSIGFRVMTPRNITTSLKTSGGSIHLSSLTGEQHFTTSGGSIKVNDLKGDINGSTSGGSIEVADCSDRIDLKTSGGSIRAMQLKGDIELRTSGGSIELTNLDGEINAHTSGGSVKGSQISGKLDAGTSGGSIRLAGISGSLKANTSAGSIEVELTKLGDYLTLSSSAGSVRVNMPLDKGADLDLRGNRVSIPLKNFDGEAEKDRVRGKINGGGVPVTLSASSGSVSVNQ